MSKRIRELAKQSTRPRGPNKPSEFDKEYFAELIVQETMRVVANWLPSNMYLDVAHAVIDHYKDEE